MNPHFLPRLDYLTACAGRKESNLSFYSGFLGLRLLEASNGWRFYSASADNRRVCLAFHFDANAPTGRHGAGQAEEVCFAIPEGAVTYWRDRAAVAGWTFCSTMRFGRPGLRLRDPDGMLLLLIEKPGVRSSAPDILGLCGTTLWVRDQRRAAALLADVFGCDEEGVDGGIRRLCLGDAHLDLQDAQEFPEGRPGRGIVEHLVLVGCEAIRAVADRLLIPASGGWLLPGGVRFRLSA